MRSPVDLMVALLVATGQAVRGGDAPLWLMEGMGQRPLFPPNVSGWKHNGYFVNASAMAKRTAGRQMFFWRLMAAYWDDAGPNAGPSRCRAARSTRAQIDRATDSDPPSATSWSTDLLATDAAHASHRPIARRPALALSPARQSLGARRRDAR